MNSNKDIRAIEIFAGTIMEAQLVKSLLENAKIETYLENEYTGTLVPWQASGGGASPVKVVISSEDVEMAQIVLEEYHKSK
jgi:hypothetical protein